MQNYSVELSTLLNRYNGNSTARGGPLRGRGGYRSGQISARENIQREIEETMEREIERRIRDRQREQLALQIQTLTQNRQQNGNYSLIADPDEDESNSQIDSTTNYQNSSDQSQMSNSDGDIDQQSSQLSNHSEQKTNCKIKLPIGLRAIIYSFLTFSSLKNQICKLSREDREILINSKFRSDILTQKKFLDITIDQDHYYDLGNLDYLIRLSNTSTFFVENFKSFESMIFQPIYKIISNMSNKIWFHFKITKNSKFNKEYVKQNLVHLAQQVQIKFLSRINDDNANFFCEFQNLRTLKCFVNTLEVPLMRLSPKQKIQLQSLSIVQQKVEVNHSDFLNLINEKDEPQLQQFHYKQSNGQLKLKIDNEFKNLQQLSKFRLKERVQKKNFSKDFYTTQKSNFDIKLLLPNPRNVTLVLDYEHYHFDFDQLLTTILQNDFKIVEVIMDTLFRNTQNFQEILLFEKWSQTNQIESFSLEFEDGHFLGISKDQKTQKYHFKFLNVDKQMINVICKKISIEFYRKVEVE